MDNFPVYPIICLLLSGILYTCGPAQKEATATEQQLVLVDSSRLAYTVDGVPRLLLGFDLSGWDVPFRQLRSLIDRIEANGGQVLIIHDSLAAQPRFADVLRRAARLGIIMRTQRNTPLLSRVGGIADFHRELLMGTGAVVYTRFSQAALNSFRSVRTLEQHVSFAELHERKNEPENWTSRRTPDSTYLYYMPGGGEVVVSIDDADQRRRRVIVVGHLGTQRAEVLEPPYASRFTLQSNDPRGGYLLITPID
jgi:hypothetical protein